MAIFNMVGGGSWGGSDSYKTFTIQRTEKSDMSSWWTYSDDATWLTVWSTEFDKFFWYYGCRLSNIWTETAKINQEWSWWYGKLDITQLGTLTSWDNVMIAFPRRWIKMSKSWSVVTLSITSDPNKVWYQYYAHTKGNYSKNTLYLWAYKMVSWYKSLSWATPLVNQSRATFRSWVKSAYDSSAWTNRYSQITIYPRWFINALYMMKYWNPNSQSVIWMWYVWWSAAVNTGWTNSQTSASYWTSSNKVQAKLFWLEDWWWNVFECMDWCYFNSSTQLTVDKTNNVFQDSNYSTNLWKASNWWLTWIDWSSDGMFRNINTSWWSWTTYYTDYSSSYASWALKAGGGWNVGAAAGAFYVEASSVSTAYVDIGSRLMFL